LEITEQRETVIVKVKSFELYVMHVTDAGISVPW